MLTTGTKTEPTIYPFWLEPFPLVLASSSAIRLSLLQAAGLPINAVPSGIDEAAFVALRQSADPADIAVELAREKTLAVSRRYGDRLVLGADQTLSMSGRLFIKAANSSAAAVQLSLLSGREHRLHSAIAIARNGCILAQAVEHACLRMRRLSPSFISNYLNAAGAEVLSSVGCYQLEGLGVHLFEQITGDHTVMLGMPLLRVLEWLRNFGSVAE